MYVIERRKRLQEELQLKDGEKELLLKVDLNIDDALTRYYKQYEQLYLSADLMKKDKVSLEEFGKAFLSLLTFIFGDEQAHEVVEFYGGNYSELLEDILPFLTDVVYPALREASKQKVANMKKRRRLK